MAVQNCRVARPYVAGSLWGDASQDRAYGNLRSAIWRLRKQAERLITADSSSLEVNPAAVVDIASVTKTADRLSNGSECRDADLDPNLFTREFLPGWYDEWTVVHRERLRQKSLHALEAIADRLTERGCHGEAIQAALAAVELDPLRESPHRCLIRSHVAEGNYSEAIARYDKYRSLLREELDLAPSPRMVAMIQEVTDHRRSGDATPALWAE
jgi:DNA-binding SARP family transcriptional activator